jgi:hypothetical protein
MGDNYNIVGLDWSALFFCCFNDHFTEVVALAY